MLDFNAKFFHDSWLAFHDEPFVLYSNEDLELLDLPDKDESFLRLSGLPEFAAPHLFFMNSQKTKGNSFFKIGEDANENSICVDINSANIVICSGKTEEIVYMNNSIRSLCYTLYEYQMMIEDAICVNGSRAFLDKNIPSKTIDNFANNIIKFDKNIFMNGAFWKIEIDKLSKESLTGRVSEA